MKSTILIVPPGSITPEDRAQANAAGYCVIECTQPDLVRLIGAESVLQNIIHTDILAMSALEAIQGQQSEPERAKFTQALYQRLKESNTPPATPA